MCYWVGCAKVRKLRKTGPIKRSQKPYTTAGIVVAGTGEVVHGYHYWVAQIISTWVKMLAATLHPLIFWPSKLVRQHLPKALKDYEHLRCNIDFIKIFIECHRELELQTITWSVYKKFKKKLKFLVGITPVGVFFCQRVHHAGGSPSIAWIHIVLMQPMYLSCQIVMTFKPSK